MADASTQSAQPDIASQEAKRLELDRERKRPGWVGRKTTALLAAGAMAFGSAPVAPERTTDQQGDVEQGNARAVDQAISRQSREHSFESRLSRERGRERARQPEQGVMPQTGMSMKEAAALAKGGPSGLAFKAIGGGGGTGPGGIPVTGEETKRMIGHALIKMSWANLWLTFGHSIYCISILFFAGWASPYLRQYIPEVGMEWFPGDITKKMPKYMFLPLKLGEILAISFVLFWVVLFDLIMVGCLAVLVALIMEAINASPFH